MSLSVLVVDDEKNARENIAAFLKKKNYEVLEASNIKEAKKTMSAGSADVIAQGVLWHMRKFAGLTRRADDVTMVVARVT